MKFRKLKRHSSFCSKPFAGDTFDSRRWRCDCVFHLELDNVPVRAPNGEMITKKRTKRSTGTSDEGEVDAMIAAAKARGYWIDQTTSVRKHLLRLEELEKLVNNEVIPYLDKRKAYLDEQLASADAKLVNLLKKKARQDALQK